MRLIGGTIWPPFLVKVKDTINEGYRWYDLASPIRKSRFFKKISEQFFEIIFKTYEIFCFLKVHIKIHSPMDVNPESNTHIPEK